MKTWLERHAMEHPGWQSWLPLIEWPTIKPRARVALDDRCLTFRGTWPDVAALAAFRPWNR